MIGWDEILDPALPKTIMIQSWRGEASLAEGARQGYQGILSAPYYLDAQKSSAQMFLADPIPADTTLTADQQKLILGGEVCMWAEQFEPGDARFAGVAAHHGNRGAVLVAPGRSGCIGYVSAFAHQLAQARGCRAAAH